MRLQNLAVLEAIDFAVRAHHGQLRKGSGQPYVVHLLDVAKRVVDAGYVDAYIVQASVLHDVIEDTTADEMKIREMFGPAVANIVSQLTFPTLPKKDYKRKQELQLKAVQEATEDAVRAIKIADKTSNLADLIKTLPWNRNTMKGYAISARTVVSAAFNSRVHCDGKMDILYYEFENTYKTLRSTLKEMKK